MPWPTPLVEKKGSTDRASVSVHESSFAARFGLGVAAYITERTGVAFEAGYILPMTGLLGEPSVIHGNALCNLRHV